MKNIPLRSKNDKSKFVIVDDEDYYFLSKFKWFLNGRYAATNYWDKLKKEQKKIYMHRLLMNTPNDMDTDHINSNKLDNRKSNLRICNRSQNQINRDKTKHNTSGYKGVFWYSKTKRWRARIKHMGKVIHIGHFITREEAARAYNEKSAFLFGEFSRTNVSLKYGENGQL